MKSIDKAILYLLAIVTMAMLYYLMMIVNTRKNVFFQSKIIHLYRDRTNHGHGTATLNNGKRIVLKDEIYYTLQINDSLVKKKGEEQITVYRRDSSFIVNYR